MKSFTVRECRQCNFKVLADEEKVVIEPNEEIEILILTTAKCSQCKMRQIRTASGPNLPFTGK